MNIRHWNNTPSPLGDGVAIPSPLRGEGQDGGGYVGGFTLLEVIMALGIMGMFMLTFINMHGSAMLKIRRAEEVTVATMLARRQMRDIQLEIEKDLAKEGFISEDKHLEGSFDEPFDAYAWEADIKKVEIPVPEEQPAAGGGGEEGGEEPSQQENMQSDIMLSIFKKISDDIKENSREIKLKIKWGKGEVGESLTLTTHMVKL